MSRAAGKPTWRQRGGRRAVAITVILLDGFAQDEVIVTVGDETRRLTDVTTMLLTGYAEQLEFEASGDVSVRIEVVTRKLDHTRTVVAGKTLLISLVEGALDIIETDETPGFM